MQSFAFEALLCPGSQLKIQEISDPITVSQLLVVKEVNIGSSLRREQDSNNGEGNTDLD